MSDCKIDDKLVDQILCSISNDKGASATILGVAATLAVGILGLFIFNRLKKRELGLEIISAELNKLKKVLLDFCLHTDYLTDNDKVMNYITPDFIKQVLDLIHSLSVSGCKRFIRWRKYHDLNGSPSLNEISVYELLFVIRQEFGSTSLYENIVFFLFRKSRTLCDKFIKFGKK